METLRRELASLSVEIYIKMGFAKECGCVYALYCSGSMYTTAHAYLKGGKNPYNKWKKPKTEARANIVHTNSKTVH